MEDIDLLIKNGFVVLEQESRPLSIGVSGGRIVGLYALGREPQARHEMDVAGMVVLPGAIDTHAHVTNREDFAFGTRTAASGGITTIIEMPLAGPPLLPNTRPEVFRERVRLGESSACVDFALWGGVTPHTLGQVDGMMDAGAVAFKVFMNYVGEEYPYFDEYSLLRLMELVGRRGGRIGVHAENESICAGYTALYRKRGDDAAVCHGKCRPPVAETEAIARLCFLASQTGCRVHICHVSCPESIDIIQHYRMLGAKVNVETCPHYLSLTDAVIPDYGAFAKCNPPLRDKARVEGMWRHLLERHVDIIGSDHSAYPEREKLQDFWSAPGGFPGMDLILPTLIDEGVHKRGLSWQTLAQITSTHAAQSFGLTQKGSIAIGKDADFAVVDPQQEWTFRNSDSHYMNHSDRYPYEGKTFRGKVCATIVRGIPVYKDGSIVANEGYGKFVPSVHPIL